MRVFCCRCGKKCTVNPNDLIARGHTDKDYLCRACTDSVRCPKTFGPHKTLNRLKGMGRDYQVIHSGWEE